MTEPTLFEQTTMSTSWLDSLSGPQRQAVFAAMRDAGKRVDYHRTKERELSAAHGTVEAGGGRFDETLAAEGLETLLRSVRKGADPSGAASEAKAATREMVGKWNKKRGRDIHTHRADIAGHAAIEHAAGQLADAAKELVKPMSKTTKSPECVIDLPAARDAAALCLKAVKARSPQPALQCIHIVAGPVGIEFRGTDMATAIGVGVPCEGLVTGAVPADLFARCVKGIDGATARLVRDGFKLRISGDSGRFDVPVTDFDMPAFDPPEGAAPLAVDGDALADAIRRAAAVAFSSNTVSAFACVHFEPMDGAIGLTGNDGKRVSSLRIPAFAKAGPGAMLTADDADRVAATVEGGPAEIMVTDRVVYVRGGQRWAKVMAQEAVPPSWRGVVAKLAPPDRVVTVDRESLLSAAQSAAVVLADQPTCTAVTLRVGGGRFRLSALSPLHGFADRSGETEADDVPGETLTCLNHKHLIDALRNAGGQRVTLGMHDARAMPLRIDEGTDHVQYISPMSVEPVAVSMPAAA